MRGFIPSKKLQKGSTGVYQTGDLIIYSGEGVCRVDAIGPVSITGANRQREYYTLSPIYRHGRIFAPVDSSVYMRPILSREEAMNLIRRIPDIEPRDYDGRGARFLTERYKNELQSNECEDLIRIIKDVYSKGLNAADHGKKLGQIDERYMKRAEDILYGELAASLDIPRDDVPAYIAQMIGEEAESA